MDVPDAITATKDLLSIRAAESARLDKIRRYWRGTQAMPAAPRGAPADIRRLAQMSRINICGLIVSVPTQSLFVDGYRASGAGEDSDGWATWQANRMDARQTGIHRAALAYGGSYVAVLPGPERPSIVGHSPRRMVAAYAPGPHDWPEMALEVCSHPKAPPTYRLYDAEGVWTLDETRPPTEVPAPKVDAFEAHNMGVCPVVRFATSANIDDDADDPIGEIEPVMPLQDQIDVTTFGCMVAEHFSAFRQRYVIGWTSDDENERLKAAASTLWTFGDDRNTVSVGEFGQTDLSGYLDSREAEVRLVAIITQTPPHELLGTMANLSAEALTAAEANHRRKVAEIEVLFGEAWEQVFEAESIARGTQPDTTAQVRWRDTESRSFAATVDGLGKLAQMLGVPTEVLWERIPGWTQQDVAAAKAAAASTDYFAQLEAYLRSSAAES